jgi:hypothetical protein
MTAWSCSILTSRRTTPSLSGSRPAARSAMSAPYNNGGFDSRRGDVSKKFGLCQGWFSPLSGGRHRVTIPRSESPVKSR